MGTTYLERYMRGGEEQAVWHELVALGGAVREEPLAVDVEVVVRETMRRVRLNLEVLIARLHSLNYRFVHAPWSPLSRMELEELNEAEAAYGPLPLALRF